MDSAARWFLAGILVSLINTGLVLVLIEIPGINDGNGDSTAEVAAPAQTFVIVVDEAGNVLSQRVALAGEAATAGGDAMAGAAGAAGDGAALALGDPVFAEIDRPSFLAAGDGIAYVATHLRFELFRVDLEGEVDEIDLDGVDDFGNTRVLDVDVTADGALHLLLGDGPLEWRLYRREEGENEWELQSSADLVGWPADVVALSVTDSGTIYISATDPAGVFRIEPDLTLVRPWVSGSRVFGLDASADDTQLLYVSPQTSPRRAEDQVGYVDAGRFGTWLSTYAGCPGEETAAAMAMAMATVTATAQPAEAATAAAAETAVATIEATPAAAATAAATAVVAEPVATAAATVEATAVATAVGAEPTASVVATVATLPDETSTVTATASPIAMAAQALTAVPRFPRDIAIAGDAGELAIVVDSLNHVVWLQQHYGPGSSIFGVPCERGDDETHLAAPQSAAIDGDGNVFISDTANNRIVILAARN